MNTVRSKTKNSAKPPIAVGDVLNVLENKQDITLPVALDVVKILGRYSERDQKLFAVLLHHAFEKLETEERFSISSRDLEKLFKEITQKDPKDWVWKSSERLMSIKVQWQEIGKDGKPYTVMVPLLTYASKREDGEVFYYEFSRTLIPTLSAPFRFGRIKTHLLLKLTGSYSLLIYQILEAFIRDTFLEVSISSFKEWLSIPENEYTDFRAFRRRVLEPAIQQINNNSIESGFIAAYSTIKCGRKVTALRFTMIKSTERKNHELIIAGKANNMVGRFSKEVYEKAKELTPGRDVTVLEKEFFEWLSKSGKNPKCLYSAFLGFCKKKGPLYGRGR